MTESNKPQAKITGRDRVFDGFFKVDELTVEMDRHDGGSQTVRRMVFERGHAVGVLGYDPVRDEVVLVNEMRPGMLAAGEYPFNDSLPAGMIDKGETAVQAALREMEEETGLKLENPVLVHAGAYVSAGGTSERLGLVAGIVDARKAGGIHGEPGEGEDIKTVVLKSGEYIARAQDGRLKDMKSMVLAFWLAQHRDELRKAALSGPARADAAEAPAKTAAPAGENAGKPQARISGRKNLYQGVFSIDEITVEMDKHDGGTQSLTRLIFERGDSIAILGYDPLRDEVVLISEMRAGMLAAGDYPYAETVPAAMIAPGEDKLAAAAVYMKRETGADLTDAEILHTGAFVSAGGTTERVTLVTGIVDASHAGGVRGRAGKGEDIKTVVLKSDEFIARAEDGRLTDMKSLAFAFWLAQHRAGLQQKAQKSESLPPPPAGRKAPGIS